MEDKLETFFDEANEGFWFYVPMRLIWDSLSSMDITVVPEESIKVEPDEVINRDYN